MVNDYACLIRTSKTKILSLCPSYRCSESGRLDKTLTVPTNTSPPCDRALQLDGDHRQLVRPLLHLRRAVRGQSDAADLAPRGQILPLLIALHHQPPCLPPPFQPGVVIFNQFMQMVTVYQHLVIFNLLFIMIFIAHHPYPPRSLSSMIFILHDPHPP